MIGGEVGGGAVTVTGMVIRGTRNVFTVRPEGSPETLECRLKGKVLKDSPDVYNPIAPGDFVSVTIKERE